VLCTRKSHLRRVLVSCSKFGTPNFAKKNVPSYLDSVLKYFLYLLQIPSIILATIVSVISIVPEQTRTLHIIAAVLSGVVSILIGVRGSLKLVNGAVQGRTCHSDVSETCPSDTSEGHIRMTCLRHVNLTHYSRLVRTDMSMGVSDLGIAQL